jgi:hypothetical protein
VNLFEAIKFAYEHIGVQVNRVADNNNDFAGIVFDGSKLLVVSDCGTKYSDYTFYLGDFECEWKAAPMKVSLEDAIDFYANGFTILHDFGECDTHGYTKTEKYVPTTYPYAESKFSLQIPFVRLHEGKWYVEGVK